MIDTLAPGRRVVLVGHSYGGLLATEFARRHPERLQGLVLVTRPRWVSAHAFKQADSARVQADDAQLRAMLPPAMAADYAVLTEQLDAPGAETPRTMPDVPVELLTATQLAAEPLFFEETAAGKALWKAQHALLFSGFTRGSHRYLATGHTLQREDPLRWWPRFNRSPAPRSSRSRQRLRPLFPATARAGAPRSTALGKGPSAFLNIVMKASPTHSPASRKRVVPVRPRRVHEWR